VQALLAAAANPESPNEVDVSQPSQALVAAADAKAALNTLFLGLGAVVLLVGAIGVVNIMIISVLECRPEIGMLPALRAARMSPTQALWAIWASEIKRMAWFHQGAPTPGWTAKFPKTEPS
jgi:hypothetical protein